MQHTYFPSGFSQMTEKRRGICLYAKFESSPSIPGAALQSDYNRHHGRVRKLTTYFQRSTPVFPGVKA
ncbi:hypothetical protein E2C01_076160 [Portunus trituberculatus]|uniref:Uncharacterized protein n=1 Tax=Portunus trituberculatus TaxID=210409 RepID=A0A5B7ILB2_PORTR|nr:hypothetical protein [Portunus trituberculatus]